MAQPSNGALKSRARISVGEFCFSAFADQPGQRPVGKPWWFIDDHAVEIQSDTDRSSLGRSFRKLFSFHRSCLLYEERVFFPTSRLSVSGDCLR